MDTVSADIRDQNGDVLVLKHAVLGLELESASQPYPMLIQREEGGRRVTPASGTCEK